MHFVLLRPREERETVPTKHLPASGEDPRSVCAHGAKSLGGEFDLASCIDALTGAQFVIESCESLDECLVLH